MLSDIGGVTLTFCNVLLVPSNSLQSDRKSQFLGRSQGPINGSGALARGQGGANRSESQAQTNGPGQGGAAPPTLFDSHRDVLLRPGFRLLRGLARDTSPMLAGTLRTRSRSEAIRLPTIRLPTPGHSQPNGWQANPLRGTPGRGPE